jgi:hypothetical protein
VDLTPSEIVEVAREDRRGFENVLLDFVTRLREEGKASSYIENYLTCVRSWLQFNDINLVRKIKIGNTSRTPTIEDEMIPPKELKQILNYAQERGRCSISFMGFSGLRPQALGNSTGIDGLEIRDLPEMEIQGNEVGFTKMPMMVVVRPEISKAKHRYFTFLGPEGCDYLKAYLEKRLAEGEDLKPGSAVIAYKKGYGDTGFREPDRYVLRAYFDTQLLVAKNNGKIAHAYRQFFMGHKGDIEARYTTNKGRLPENVIEDMRGSYRKSLEYLETRKTQIAEDKLRDAMRRQLLLVAGFSGEEIDELDTDMSDEEFQERVRRKLLGPMNNGNSQKVVNMDELAGFLEQGWNFVATIKNDKAIVKLP